MAKPTYIPKKHLEPNDSDFEYRHLRVNRLQNLEESVLKHLMSYGREVTVKMLQVAPV